MTTLLARAIAAKAPPDAKRAAATNKDAAEKREALEREKFWDEFGKDFKHKMGVRIRAAREENKLTLAALAKLVNKHAHASVLNWEQGTASPQIFEVARLANALGKKPEYLAFGVDNKPKVVLPPPDELGFMIVPEVTFGDTVKKRNETQRWGLALPWLKSEIGVTDLDDLFIYRTQVAAGQYEHGDRVIVDASAAGQQLAQPGDFLCWDDKFGPVIWRVVVLPGIGSKKRLARVTAGSGKATNTEDMPIDKLHIIGRVRGVWRGA